MQLAYKWQASIIVAVGLFMSVLDNTIVSVALPRIQQAFHTDFETVTWAASAYFLAEAAVTPMTGYLTDRVGTKRIFIAALVLFTLGSALCAVAPTQALLVAWRAVQGCGAGALFPTAYAIIYRLFPPVERGRATAILAVPVLLGPLFGPLIGGYLTTNVDWRAIFVINIPVGVLAGIVAWRILRSATEELSDSGEIGKVGQHLDIAGLVLSTAGFTALVYGITEAGSNGWGDATVLRFLIAGAVILIVFALVELRSSDPVLDLRLFLNYTFSVANGLQWALIAFFVGCLFLLPYFFENVQGMTPVDTGRAMVVQGLAAAIGVLLAGSLYNRLGPRLLSTTGFALFTLAMIGPTHLDVSTTAQSLQAWLALLGCGLGLSAISLQTLSVSVVSNRAMARASSLGAATRQVASAIGVAALATHLTQQSRGHLTSLTVVFGERRMPTGAAERCLASSQGFLSELRACLVHHAIVMGLNDAFTVVMAGAGICTLLALLVGRDPTLQAGRSVSRSASPAQLSRAHEA
jgi:EmrB/QacA subfamily drug resistance transporter